MMIRRRLQSVRLAAVGVVLALMACNAMFLPSQAAVQYSTDITVDLSGTTVDDEDVASDDLFGAVVRLDLTGFPQAADVDAYQRILPSNELLFSFGTTVALPGGVTADEGDVVRFDGTVYSLEFDASAEGFPEGVNLDAVGVIEGDLLLSFDQPVSAGGIAADSEDLLRFDGASFSLFFDGSTEGVAPEMNLDAAHYSSGDSHLFVSFDTSGVIGALSFDDEDILDFDGGSTWSLAYDGSAQHAGWPEADLDAVSLPCTLISDSPPQVIAVQPQDDSLGAIPGTNVTVTFSEPVAPASVTSSTFRLLDGTGTPVLPVAISVDPSGLLVTLDPTPALVLDTLYTVEIASDLLDPGGCRAVPFTSQFVVGAADDQLDQVSNETAPPPASLANAGTAVAQGGDINGDGIGDLLVGAPGLDVGAVGEAGAVLIYFGDTTGTDLSAPDIVFEGVAAHDRVGVSVAGGFDFNSPGLSGPDGVPDILIGAEQTNRTGTVDGACPAEECGAGKVYVIFFDPTDVTHYPNLGNPALSDTVSLALVESGAIPGIVLTGVTVGDKAGFSVAAGGDVDGDTRDDLLIGAPETDPAGLADAGTAYVIFNDSTLSGTDSLADVACTSRVSPCAGPDEIDGFVYEGGHAGDHFGFAVAFPGDVVGSVGDDVAVGAPDLSPESPTRAAINNAGAAFVMEGGTLASGIIEVCPVGDTVNGVRYVGTQAGERLGASIAGGGDALLDGSPDLLIGAPKYDTVPLTDAGRVIHIGTKQPTSIIEASSVGSTVNGAIWEGSQAGGELGTSVAGLGDINGDGIEDIGLGMPLADIGGFESARLAGVAKRTASSHAGGTGDEGAVFRIDGTILSGSGPATVDVGLIGQTHPGVILVGAAANERAGSSLVGAGDLSGDLARDFAVGAPGIAANDDGRVYVVLATPPSTCRPEYGCTVVDLQQGAQLEVGVGSLTDQLVLTIRSIVDPAELPAPPPAGRSLLGAVEFGAEASLGTIFGVPNPTLYLPARSELEAQLGVGVPCADPDLFDVWFYNGTTWIDSGVDGTLEPNPQLAGRKAVRGTLDTLYSHFAVFIADADGDDFRTCLDCDDSGASGSELVWATPQVVQDVAICRLCNGGSNDLHVGCGVTPDCTSDGDCPGGACQTTLSWTAPGKPGSVTFGYSVIRSTDPADFDGAAAVCVEDPITLTGSCLSGGTPCTETSECSPGDACAISLDPGTVSSDPDPDPDPGAWYYYLVRAENTCPGALGAGDLGPGRTALDCP